MPGFSDYESPQEFKDRLNSLTEKLKKISTEDFYVRGGVDAE